MQEPVLDYLKPEKLPRGLQPNKVQARYRREIRITQIAAPCMLLGLERDKPSNHGLAMDYMAISARYRLDILRPIKSKDISMNELS